MEKFTRIAVGNTYYLQNKWTAGATNEACQLGGFEWLRYLDMNWEDA